MLPVVLILGWLIVSFSISFAFPFQTIGRNWANDPPWKLVGLLIFALLFWPLSLVFAPLVAAYYPPDDQSTNEHIKHRFLASLFAPVLILFAADGVGTHGGSKGVLSVCGIALAYLVNFFVLATLIRSFGFAG